MLEENSPQIVEEKKIVTGGKTVMSFTLPSPLWAKMVFRAEFIANKAFLMALSQGLLPTLDTKITLAWAVIIDFIVWGLAKGVGIKKEDFES